MIGRDEPAGTPAPVTVVVATRDRRDRAVDTVRRLRGLAHPPAVVVVDDGSTDGTAEAVRAASPEVEVLRHRRSRGVAEARNVGTRAAATPYVAFSDDDSWWEEGALDAAVEVLRAHPRLALLAARILVGERGGLDPVCEAMARSPLDSEGLPSRRVLGFVACGLVLCRDAFLGVGGFPARYRIGGEEEPLALALASAGWDLAYVPGVVARHAPTDSHGDRGGRVRAIARNDLWTAWTYRRPAGALRATGRAFRDATTLAEVAGLAEAVLGAPWALRRRRAVPPHVEAQRRVLEGGDRGREAVGGVQS